VSRPRGRAQAVRPASEAGHGARPGAAEARRAPVVRGFRSERAVARRPALARDRDRARRRGEGSPPRRADGGARADRHGDRRRADQPHCPGGGPDRALRRARHGGRLRDRRLHHCPQQGRGAGGGHPGRDQGERGGPRGLSRGRGAHPGRGGAELVIQVSGLNVFYGKSQVVFDLDLVVGKGEIVTLLGRNGAGKTSTLLGNAGEAAAKTTSMTVEEREIGHLPYFKRVRAGISMVPSGSRAFPNLTVEENLAMVRGASNGTGWTVRDVYTFFPALAAL